MNTRRSRAVISFSLTTATTSPFTSESGNALVAPRSSPPHAASPSETTAAARHMQARRNIP
ncbi:MAG: hypothetical protein OEO21_13445 [Candidatus Krumholzibacteria bacterium]|nr:hypothetical protein [Candidatus Krumholzibacteria bacterium]